MHNSTKEREKMSELRQERLGIEIENEYCQERVWGCGTSIKHTHSKTPITRIELGKEVKHLPICPQCGKRLESHDAKEHIISPLLCVNEKCDWFKKVTLPIIK